MSPTLHRGALLHFLDDPREGAPGDREHDQRGNSARGAGGSYEYFADGGLLVVDGLVAAVGPYHDVAKRAAHGVEEVFHRDALLLPGFIDTHTHYPQMDIVAAHGEQLLEWLERYVFPMEARFGDYAYAQRVAERFLRELLRNGTTSALVFGTVHPESVDAFFDAAAALDLRMIAGKVLMDRNAPEWLRDTAESGYRDSRDLIERWHDRGRLAYAVTPRFAPTSSPEQLALAGRLLEEHPGVYLHTHMSESANEVAWVQELFPQAEHYLHSYDEAGLLGRRSIFAHCVHLGEEEWQRMGAAGCSAAFCPTSNLFLGSGLFSLERAQAHGVAVGLGTDIGAGTSFSLLQTMGEAYKVQQLQGLSLAPLETLYLATLGGARVLDLEDRLGNFLPGKEADFVVLDLAATRLLEERIAHCETPEEIVFVLSMLGDDRAVRETWILGRRRHRRDGPASEASAGVPL